ncbi:MAG: phenylacetate--CoA ligase family protein [Nitrospirae bacterium]|nr:phenylacetate--CoA ligase family protein [Nitrospirota bacterium]
MGTLETIKKFLGLAKLERVALEIYERLPLFFRYKFIYGRSYLHWRAFLQESEKWDKDRIKAYQIEQLKNLLKHAIKNIPYYKKLFSDYGFDPERLQTLDDIKVLPYLNKETVRDSLHEFIDSSVPRKSLLMKSTSGSTGIPLTFYKTKEPQRIFTAFWDDLLLRAGCTPKSKIVMFWGMIKLGKRKYPFLKYGNRLILSVNYITDKWMQTFYNTIVRFEPEFIIGYPNTLAIFSAYIKEKGYSNFKSLKTVITQSETLYHWQRNLIEEALGVRVFSIYVMTELAVFAGECEHSSSLHTYPQYGLTEFISLDNDHKEIITTGFTNYVMPLIRYKTNDIGMRGNDSCPECGRKHQLIDMIEGRINDFLINKEEKVIPRLMPWIRVFPNTKQYQFFQEQLGKAYLKVVKTEKYTDTDTIFIKSKLAEMLGHMKETLDIEIIFTDDISRTPSGKIIIVDQRLNIRKFLVG